MTKNSIGWLGLVLLVAGAVVYIQNRPRPISWWNPLPTDIPVPARVYVPDEECREFIRSLPPHYRYAKITVPENWGEPRGPQIEVFYYWNTGNFAGRTPIAFFNGGPTYDSHATFAAMKDAIERHRVPFVFIDQRGTGCSTPYPRELNEATVKRLGHYGSAAVVRDADAIRARLFGHQKWRIFGQSAGGWMVFRYLELLPENIEAAYAHGAALNGDEVAEMVARLKSQRRVSENYFKRFPHDMALWREAQTRIPQDLCFSDGTTRICGPGILDALITNLGFGNRKGSSHEWIQSLKGRNDAEFREWLKEFVTHFFFGTYVGGNSYAATALGLLEVAGGDQDACAAAHERLEREGEHPLEWPLNECRMEQSVERKWTEVVLTLKAREPYHLDTVAEQLAHHPDLPLYLYASRQDSFVPVESYRETLTRLGGRAIYREFTASGHEGYFTEAAIWSDLRRPRRPAAAKSATAP